MITYFANPSRGKVLEAMTSGRLGFIDTPSQGNLRPAGVTWCADNGCFGKGYPGHAGWLRWLAKHRAHVDTCRFATAPDVVGDAAATLRKSAPFYDKVRALGYPVALVAQNGLEFLDVPWKSFDCLFLGGSLECVDCDYVRPMDEGPPKRQEWCPFCDSLLTEWKLGPPAAALVQEAKARDKWVHMGRVNSRKRLTYAQMIGCDSADGTYLTRGPDKNLPTLLGWLDGLNEAA